MIDRLPKGLYLKAEEGTGRRRSNIASAVPSAFGLPNNWNQKSVEE
jgi:beta-glucosidase-like glycosyl hydrolase